MKLRSVLLPVSVICVVGAAFYFGLGAFFDPCRNQEVGSFVAPGGKVKAVTFQRDCGATTGFSTQISILGASRNLPNESGNIFVADCDHGAAPAAPHGGPEVILVWLDSSHLEVRFHPKARVFLSEPSFDGISITYVRSLTQSENAHKG